MTVESTLDSVGGASERIDALKRIVASGKINLSGTVLSFRLSLITGFDSTKCPSLRKCSHNKLKSSFW